MHDLGGPVLAIDGQALAGDRPTGLGRVARAVALELAGDPSLSLLPLMPPAPEGFARAWERFVWEQATLPCKAKDQHAAVLYSPAFGCPRLSATPRILMVHDLIPRLQRWETGRASWYWSRYLPESATWAEAVVTNSRQTALDLMRLVPVDPARVLVNPLGAPWGIDDPVDTTWWDQRRPFDRYVLFVGSLVPRKAPALLLDALALLRDRGLDLPAILVGDGGAHRWELQSRATQLGLADQLHWASFVADDELLHAMYAGAEMLVSPSLAEGFNLPLLEATQCGTAVVASDLPVHRELLGAGALYATPGDAAALADAIAALWTSLEHRQTLNAEAVRRTRSYTWRAHAAGIAALAHALASRSPLPSQAAFDELRAAASVPV